MGDTVRVVARIMAQLMMKGNLNDREEPELFSLAAEDKSYITNSYHVHVTEPIDAFTKLTFESEFQELSPGGAISYVEVPNLQNNIPAVLALMRHIYETILRCFMPQAFPRNTAQRRGASATRRKSPRH